MKNLMDIDMDLNMDLKIKILLSILWVGVVVSNGIVKIFQYFYKFLKFLVKIYKLYIYIILAIPVYLPFHIIDRNYSYEFPGYIIIYDMVILFGGFLYFARMTEMKERKEMQKYRETLDQKYGRHKVDLRTEGRNSSWNNFNSYKPKERFSAKEISNKKKNIRKILKEKELI